MMKRGVIWIALTLLLVVSLVFTSCNSSTTITKITTQPTTQPTMIASTTSKTTSVTAQPSSTTSTASTGANWWDSLGKPQYGGTMTFRLNANIASFDPYNAETLINVEEMWFERLFSDDWTKNPTIWNYQILFRPTEDAIGQLAGSWEFTDLGNLVVHLRQGIHWQNIAPVNGREFTSDDVVFHFNRIFGLGGGFTKPAPYYANVTRWAPLKSVTANDKYTVTFNWGGLNPEIILETLRGPSTAVDEEAPEVVQAYGSTNDWRRAVGTGPYILTDFVSGSSATLVKNPNYWGYDERYPKNQLPYLDKVNILVIPDDATALAGLRTGKIDLINQISVQQASQIQKTNPEITQLPIIISHTTTVDPRMDVTPFKDIKVREAMQMAIDLPTIAKNYYGGTVSPDPSTLTSNYMTGWGFPYSQWSQDLKNQYAYNPTAAKQLLAAAGYPNGFKTDIVAVSSGDLDLLQIVKSYFSAVGIDMDIRTMDTASWTAFVQVGHKHDQLAIDGYNGQLGQTYEPPTQLSRFQTGYSVNWCMVSDPVFDAFYPAALSAPTADALKKVVADANLYIAQQHWSISLLQPLVVNLFEPWLKGFNGQFGQTTGDFEFQGFYIARFWIDSSLKKSLGY